MEFIKPREGFFKNIANCITIGNYVRKKLKGREELFSDLSNDYGIKIVYTGKDKESEHLILSKLAEELNKDCVEGLNLFEVSTYGYPEYKDYGVFLSTDCEDLSLNKSGFIHLYGREGYAEIKAPLRFGSGISSKLLRFGRVDTDLKELLSIVCNRCGFAENGEPNVNVSLTFDRTDLDTETDFVFMYSIRCSTPEIAERFAEEWVLAIQEEDMQRYSYLNQSMIDPFLMNPDYHGINRVYGDQSVLIGFVQIDRCMCQQNWLAYDKNLLPSNSEWWLV